MATKTLVVLIYGSGSNLQALIDACASGTISAQIGLVISNEADAYGLTRAKNAGIPVAVLDHRQFDDRDGFDAALAEMIQAAQPDGVILAGFMRILTPAFVQQFAGRMLNIHPSLLPKYRGLHTHRRALEAGDTVHGLSIHFVTAELDGGPVIAQAEVPVLPQDTEATLATRVLQQEHRLYPMVAQWLIDGTLALQDDQVCFQGLALAAPLRFVA